MENQKMTKERWEQAVKAGSNDRNYRRERGFTETRDDYFVDGVQWADENPREGLIDVDTLWHDVSEEPDFKHFILLYDEENAYLSAPCRWPFKDMPGFVKVMNKKNGANYTKWVYMKDIIPKSSANINRI